MSGRDMGDARARLVRRLWGMLVPAVSVAWLVRVWCGVLRVAPCVVVVLVMVGAAPAFGLAGRGHVFVGSFAGSGEQRLRNPTGVAVDEATGEVYVADPALGHERVERFRPDGNGGYEFVSAFNVRSPEEIAVDNSTDPSDPSRGDVYVVGAEEEEAPSEEHDVLYKYSPLTSKMIFKKTMFHASGEEELALEDVNGVAVDGNGGLWVYWGEEGMVSGFTDAETNRWEPAATKDLEVPSLFECRATPGFAVAPDDSAFYVAHERESALEECLEEEGAVSLVAKFDAAGAVVARGVDQQPTSGVASEAEGNVYVDNGGSVAAFTADGSLIQRFGSGALVGGGAVAAVAQGDVFVAEPAEGKVAVFAPAGAGPPSVDGVYAQSLSASSERVTVSVDPDGAQTTYYVQYGTASCVEDPAVCMDEPAPPGAVVGSGFGDRTIGEEVAGLVPNTTYYYRVLATNEDGVSESAQNGETFFTTLPSADGVLADDREWEQVSPPEKHGAAIEPISREGALIQASANGDAISWTASSPVTSEGQGNRRPEPVQVLSSRGSEGWSSQDIATPHTKGEGYEPGEATEYRFFSPDLSTALVQPQVPKEPLENPPLAPEASEKTLYLRDEASGEFQPLVTGADDTAGTPFGGKLEFEGATPDLSRVVFGSQVPLITGATGEGLYEWESGSPLTLVSVLPDGTAAGEPSLGDLGRDVRGAFSADGSRVFWTEGLGGGTDEGPLYMRNLATEKTLQVNAAQSVAEPGEEEQAEGLDEVHFQTASADGGRVFFTDSWPLTGESSLEPLDTVEVLEEAPGKSRSVGRPMELYEYDVATGRLVDLTVDHQVGEAADVLGTIPGASENGEYVYFVANGVLAPGAQPGNCQRTNPYNLPHPDEACNLYVSEPSPDDPGQRQTRLIARLSEEDAADWGEGNSPLPGDLGGVTSQVSSNGRYLAFMSERELTGYDNVDADPETKGAHDEEVYLYDAQNGRLVCASCDPGGRPPDGVFDTEEAGEGLGLTVDRPETWTGHWLAGSIPGWTLFELNNPVAEHQSRYLTNNGRLFFDSADALLSQVTARTREEAVNGKPQQVGVENVYEYEPSGEGTCTAAPGCVALISSGTSEQESAFLDASESGNDVFFITAAQLVPQDTDNSLDIYDARVCGTPGSEACLPIKPPPPAECAGEECRPAQTTEQAFEVTGTNTLHAPASAGGTEVHGSSTTVKPKPETNAQKLAAALKLCKKLKSRHKRGVCQAKTRKRYPVKRTHAKRARRSARRTRRPR